MTVAERTFTKVVRPGRVPLYNGRKIDVFCEIKWDGHRLSITGVEGPTRNGNASGSCGQIDGGYEHRDPAENDSRSRHLTRPDEIDYAPGWSADLWLDFLHVWHIYHCNDLQAACEHQRALGWTYNTHRGQKCPECGYEIGTEWKYLAVPEEALDFLAKLPDSDKEPAWV